MGPKDLLLLLVLQITGLSMLKKVNVLYTMLWTRQLPERPDKGFIISAIRQTTTPRILASQISSGCAANSGQLSAGWARVLVWLQLLLATGTHISKIFNGKKVTPKRKLSLCLFYIFYSRWSCTTSGQDHVSEPRVNT